MTDLSKVSLTDLENELKRRNKIVVEDECWKCNNWPTLYHAYQTHYPALHCYGCRRECQDCDCY